MPAKKKQKKKQVKKKPVKAPAKKRAKTTPTAKKIVAAKKQEMVGVVTHFFTSIKVAIIKFKKPVSVGARIGFRGATTEFDQALSSMQYDHQDINRAPKGKEVGVKVSKRVREGDTVFLIG
jgi:putative protease